MADFIVKSGIKLDGNISGANYLFANNIVVSYTGLFGNLSVTDTATVNNLIVAGDLTVQGNTVTLNTATLTVEDKNILLANGAVNATQAQGAGLTIAGANASIIYDNNYNQNQLVVNKNLLVQNANLMVDGTLNVYGNVNLAKPAFIDYDPIITLDPLNQSIALLRSYMDRPVGNVIFVSGTGNDNNSGNSIANALANIHTALNRAEPWTTVFVKSGDYVLYQQPVTIKRRVGIVGDNLRTTTIRPAERTKDMFYVNNACYVTGFTFRDHLSPAAVFSYNPDGSAGFISTSPYIQNSSSITTTGTGMRVDGNYVSGLRSMVCDSYTNTNEGGIGIHMLNRGYTQLVSVFTICCDIAILCENGGFCSITNSNASFGRLGLLARGVSQPLNFGSYSNPVDTDEGTKYLITNLDRRPNYGDAVLFANYDQAKCARDTGLIVDALALDMAYQSNTQSAFAGLQYWAQAESAIPTQADETIAAFTYAKNLATNVALNVTITNPKQSNVYQSFSIGGTTIGTIQNVAGADANVGFFFGGFTGGNVFGPIGPGWTVQNQPSWLVTAVDPNNQLITIKNGTFISGQAYGFVSPGGAGGWTTKVSDGFDLVANIITSGTIGVTDRIITNSFPANTNVQINNSANAIIANKEFIKKEVIAYVNQTYPGFFANSANFIDVANAATKCERDTGYLIDSIVFDLLHGGNRQAITSGVYYYQSATQTQIADQVVQTSAAYDFIGTIIEKIIKNKKIGPYNQEKCERDTGLIVDSLLIDLAYGSNTQSTFSGLQYWSQSSSAIPNQSTETLAAINYAKRLASNIASGNYATIQMALKQANVSIVSYSLPFSGPDLGVERAKVDTEFDLISNIITGGTVSVTDRIVPNRYPANTNVVVDNVANAIIANKDFVAAEVIAYVNQTYPGFFANANNFISPLTAANVCARDVGYILDSIAFDLRHDGNRQAIQSGVYYYNYNANVTQINNQIVQTGLAYDFIGRVVTDVVKNKKFAAYNQEKCERDTGLIVDALAFDLAYSGNSQANFAGLQYWSQSESAIPNQAVETIAAINYAKRLASNVAQNISIASPKQFVVTQTTGPEGSSSAAATINTNFNTITDIITNGTVGVTDRIVSNQYPALTSNTITNSANLVIANKSFIQAEVIAFVNQTYPGFFANASHFIDPANAETRCSRDVGYILDSVTFDLLHTGNKQSIQSGVYYYNYNANVTQINDQIVKTGQAYTFIGNLVDALVSNTTITSLYQTDVTQNTLVAPAATILEAAKTLQSVNLITNIITNGPTSAVTKIPISLTASNNANVVNAVKIILANKDFIKAETIAYINEVMWDPPYQSDVKQNTIAYAAATQAEANLVLNNIAIIKNIIANGPTVAPAKKPISYNTGATANISNAAKIILANKEYIKAETIAYINKDIFDPPYQSRVKQNTTAASAATIAEANIVLNNINLITDIIEQGPSVAPAKRPISYSTLSTNPNVINAAKIVLANKSYITAEVTNYINRNWANISNGAVAFYTVANSTPLVANTSLVTLLEGDTDTTIRANSAVSFHQPSYISALGYTFEYIGSGTNIQTALPYNGGFPIQENEVTEEKGGRVYFTSTDQQGDFRIGTELVFNRVDGTISGRTFTKALFSVMTPYILAIEG